MKKFSLVLVNISLVFVLILCLGISKVEASTFLGVFCWQTAETGDPGSPDIIKLAVSDADNQHFILNGEELDSSGSSNNIVFHGSAEIIGSNVIMTLNGSFDGNNVTESMVMNVTISTSTLNGAYNQIEHTFNKATETMTTEHSSGTATFASCP